MVKQKRNRNVIWGSAVKDELPELANLSLTIDRNGLGYSELFLNYNAESPGLYYRDSEDNIKQISGGGITDFTVLDKRYLRKDQDDTANGSISFRQNARSYIYLEDIYTGLGWQLSADGSGRMDRLFIRESFRTVGETGSYRFTSGFPDGIGWDLSPYDYLNAADVIEEKWRLEIDDIIVRGRLRVFEFIISQLRGENDNVIFAGMMKVDHYNAGEGRIYLQTGEGILYNPFRAGDILLMQRYGGMPSAENNYNVIKQYELRVTEAYIGNMLDGKNRLDYITFSNFIGDVSDIADGDVLCRVDSVTDSTRKGIVKIYTIDEKAAPYVDVVYGMKTDPMNSLKARMGNLSGIVIKSGVTLSNVWGLYANGAYIENSTVILQNGNTVEQEFSVMNGEFTSQINGIRDEIASTGYNVLRNSTFGADVVDLRYWTHVDDISIIKVGSELLWFNSNFYSYKRKVADIYWDSEARRNTLRVLGTTIYQPNENMNFTSTMLEGMFSFSFNYKVTRAGVLKIGVPNTEIYEEIALDQTTTYQKFTKAGEWDMKGNFEISFTGEILIYGIALTQDEMADTIQRLWTRIYQNEEQISLSATKEYLNSVTGEIITKFESELLITAEAISAVVTEVNNMGQKFESELLVTSRAISAAVSEIDNLGQRFDSELLVTSKQISAITTEVTALGVQAAGFITTANATSLFATKNGIISFINVSPESIQINASRINLIGAVTFDMFNSSTQNTINTANSNANSAINTANAAVSAYNSVASDLKNLSTTVGNNYTTLSNRFNNLGALAGYDTVGKAMLDSTLIVGGLILTSLIDVNSIFAKQATIGGFAISGETITSYTNILTGSYPYEYTTIAPTGIGFYKTRRLSSDNLIYAGFGTYSAPSTLGVAVPVWVSNSAPSTSTVSYGIYVNVTGGSYNNNHAINIDRGFISGFAIKPLQTTSGTTLTNNDCYVTCYNTSAISVYLPSNPNPGKLIFIRLMNNYTVTVYGNGKGIHNDQNNPSMTSIRAGNTHGNCGVFFYDGQYWCYNEIGRA